MIKFFKIQSESKPEYYAAFSKEHMMRFLGDPEDIFSNIRGFGHKLETLEEITLQEAAKARNYREFMLNSGLCMDGIYMLGSENSADEYNPEQLYLMPRDRDLN